MTDPNIVRLLKLLESKDRAHIAQAFELYSSLQSPGLGRAMIAAMSGREEGEMPWELELDVSMREDEFEPCIFTAGEESWAGGVQHIGKTSITFNFSSDDTAAIAVVVACIMENHWDSEVSDDLPWDYPDGVNGKASESFHLAADGTIRQGEPEPDPDSLEDVEREYTDGVGSVYTAQNGFVCGNDGSQLSVYGVDIERADTRSMLLVLAMTLELDLEALPTIDRSAGESLVEVLREDCCAQ
jgi:hypothetical protein